MTDIHLSTFFRACAHLIPMIRNFHQSEMKFSPVPYTQLDFNYRVCFVETFALFRSFLHLSIQDSVASHFIQSHQLVLSLHNEPELKGRILGAIVLYKNRYLYLSRWMTILLD